MVANDDDVAIPQAKTSVEGLLAGAFQLHLPSPHLSGYPANIFNTEVSIIGHGYNEIVPGSNVPLASETPMAYHHYSDLERMSPGVIAG
jgi:hypothetical protein